MRFSYQALKHLVNKWQGEMVFPGCLIEPLIVNAYSPVVLHPGWDQLVLVILHYSEACLLGHNMDQADPLTI